MARRKSTQTLSDEQVDRDIETGTSLGRIEGKLDSMSGRMDRFELATTARMSAHDDHDTRMFAEVQRKHEEAIKAMDEAGEARIEKINTKLDTVINNQSAMTGGWRVLTIIISAAAALGGIVATAIHYFLGR